MLGFGKLRKKIKRGINNLEKRVEFISKFISEVVSDGDAFGRGEQDDFRRYSEPENISLEDIENEINQIYKNFKILNKESIEEDISLEKKIKYFVSKLQDAKNKFISKYECKYNLDETLFEENYDMNLSEVSFGEKYEEGKFYCLFKGKEIMSQTKFISMIDFFENLEDINEDSILNMLSGFVDFYNKRRSLLNKYPKKDLLNLKLVNKDFNNLLEAEEFKDIHFNRSKNGLLNKLKKILFNPKKIFHLNRPKNGSFSKLPTDVLPQIFSYVVRVNDDFVSDNPLIKDYIREKLFKGSEVKIGFVQKYELKNKEKNNRNRSL